MTEARSSMGTGLFVSYDGRMRNYLTTTGATLRLTRLVVSDSLGEWYLYGPAEKWAIHHEGTDYELADGTPTLDETKGWRSKLVTGLGCPFCVGFWIGAAVLATDELTKGTKLERGWGLAKTALTINYVTAHISSRLDAGDSQEPDHE